MKECVNVYNPSRDFANVQLEILLNPGGWQDWVKSNFAERDAGEIIEAVNNGTFDMDFKVPEKTNVAPDDTFNVDDDSTEDSYNAIPANMSVKGFYYSQYTGVGNVTSSFNRMMREFTKRIMSNLVYDLENKQIIDVTEQIDGTDRVNLFLTDYKIELIESLREVTHSDIDHLNFSDPNDLTKAINKVLHDYKNIQLSDEAKPKYDDYVILSNFNKLLEERFDWIAIKPEYQHTSLHSRDMYEYHDSKVKHRQSYENEKDEGGKSISDYTSSYMKRLLEFIPEVDSKTGRDLTGLNVGFAGFCRVITLIRDWAMNSPEAPHRAYTEILKGEDADFDYIIDAYLGSGIKTEYGTFLVNKIHGIKKYILGNNVPKNIKNLFIGQMSKMVSCRHIAYEKVRDPKTKRMTVVRKDLRDRVSDLQSLRLRGTMRAVVYKNQSNPAFFDEMFKDRIEVDKHGIITLKGNVYGRGSTSIRFIPEYDEETGNLKYISENSLSQVDDNFTAELIRDVLQIDLPLDQIDDLKNLVREDSLMQIFGHALTITIGASKDLDRSRFKYINDKWELDTSGYGNMVSNASQCLSLLYGSETLNVLKDLKGNSIPVFQLGSLFYDIKKIINDLADNNKGVLYGNSFVQNPKLLGEVYTRNDYDERGNVTKAKEMSEGDLNYLSAYQDFYVNLRDSKNILLQPTCYADKVRFALFEVRTGSHDILYGDSSYTAAELLSTIADSFETSEYVDRGQTHIKINEKKSKAKDAMIGEIARVRQDKIKRQLIDVITRLSGILNITLPVSTNLSYEQISNVIKKIHKEFAKKGIDSPDKLRALQKKTNELRVKQGKSKIDLCETYDVVIGKSGLEINEVLLNNAELYWDWNNGVKSTQIAFRERIARETMKYAKILYGARFSFNASYDPSLNSYYETLKESNPEEAAKWINSVTGKLKSFRLFEKGTRNEVMPNDADLSESFDPTKYDIELNPMLESYMLADMLYSTQITDVMFGDVASYPNKVKNKSKLSNDAVIQQGEANRLVTMHKRTMVGGSTRHRMLFMPFGSPRKINIATVADIEQAMWNLTGINTKDKTQDGCGFSSPYMTVMENWSYLDGAGTGNRKTIFGYTDPKTGVFTEIKWACFDLSNEARRTSPSNPSYSAERMYQRMHSAPIGASIIDLDFKRFWGKDSYYSTIEGYETKKITTDTDVYWWDDTTDTHWKLISLQNNNGTVIRIKQQVNENGVTFGPTKKETIKINSVADIDSLFGGCFNETLVDGKLKWGDSNVQIVTNILCEMDWRNKITHYCINESAVKVGMWNINDSDSFAEGKSGELDTFEIDASYGGIQMDASHLAEDGQVTEMMQTVASLIQNGYRADTVNDIYQTIGEIALDAMSDIFDAREVSDERAIYEILGKAFIKSLSTGEKDSLGLAQAFVTIAEQELINKNIKITLPFSAATIKPKFMSVVTSFTNKSGIRRKYSGLGTVQAPSYGYMQFHDFDVVDQFGKRSKIQVDYKGAIGYLKQTLGIDDPKRALIDQNYALEKGLLQKVTSRSDFELEDTIVVKPKFYSGNDVGYRVKIVSWQQLDFYRNLLWGSGGYEVYKWNGQPKDLRSSDTVITVSDGIRSEKISLMDLDLNRAIAYAGDLSSEKRNMKSSDLDAVRISMDNVNRLKLKFLVKVLRQELTIDDIADSVDPETEESPISGLWLDDSIAEKTVMENLPYLIEILKVKIQEFNTELSEVYNNRKPYVTISSSVFGNIPLRATKVEFTPPEIMMSNSYKRVLGIKDGDNISDVTGPEYFLRNISASFKFPLSSELDPNLYDAMLVTAEGEKVFVSLAGKGIPLTTDDSYQSIDGKIWHKGERVASADGKSFGQYVGKNGEKFHFVIVENLERLQELTNSKHFNNVRYNYTESNAQLLLEHLYPDNFEEGQIIAPIQLLKGVREQGASITRLDSIPAMIDKLRVNEQVLVEQRIQRLAEKKYDAFVETLNFIGARIPTQSMQSFSAAKVVRFIDAPTNEVYLPRIVSWLEGSDYDIDKWYLMGLSLLQDGSVATFSNLSDTFSYKEVFKLPIPSKRSFQQYVPAAVSPNVEMISFKKQNPKTAEIYNVTTYKLKESENAIEVSKLGDGWHVEVIGKPRKAEFTALYSALSVDALRETDTIILHGKDLDRYGFTKTTDGFIKPDESELYMVTPADIANIKIGIIEPLNRILRHKHSILKFDPTIDPEDARLILRYLNIHEQSERSAYEKTEALKNKVFYGIQDVVSDPIAQINLHTPIAMSDPQAAAANSTLGNEEKEFTADNPGVKFKMQLQNMAGKDVTGIGAVSLKSFFAATYFFNRMASEIRDLIIQLKEERKLGIDTSKTEQDIFNRINWIVFDSKLGKSELRCLSNVYWKPVMDLLDETTLTINIEWTENKAALNLQQFISGNTLELNELIQHLDKTSKLNNAADTISALVSAATDNAKELILAKINATSKFADIYTLLLNTGMSFKEISEFMMSPIFNVVNDFITPNMFDPRTKFLKVEDVVEFVLDQSAILVNTNTFDNVLLHYDPSSASGTSFILKLIYEIDNDGKITKNIRKDSPLKPILANYTTVSEFLADYKVRFDKRFSKDSSRNIYLNLKAEIYDIIENSPLAQEILLKHLEEQITTKKGLEKKAKFDPNEDMQLEDSTQQDVPEETEGEGFASIKMKSYSDVTSYEMLQLYNYVEDYLLPKMRKLKGIRTNIAKDLDNHIRNLRTIDPDDLTIEDKRLLNMNNEEREQYVANLYNNQKAKLGQLLSVLPACEEQQFLGRMLGVNKGLKTDDYEEYSWIRSFEIFVNKRLKNVADEPFDFLLFVSDEAYRDKFVELYEGVKALYNPLRIVSMAQHFSSMLKLVETNRYLLERSAAVRLERKIAKDILSEGHEKTNGAIQSADTKKLTQKEFAQVKTYVSDILTVNWFYNLDGLVIQIPENVTSYKNGNKVTVARNKVKLNDLDGLASFKHFMDTYVIPKLIYISNTQGLDGKGTKNNFLSNLILDHRTDFRSGEPIIFYKPNVEMMSVDGTLKTAEIYESMLEGFNKICHMDVSKILGIDTPWTFGDLFFVYDLITNKNGYGNESFARFFEDIAKFGNKHTLVNKYHQYLSELDNGSIDVSDLQYNLDDLRIRLAHLPGAESKFGVLLEKDGNIAVSVTIGEVNQYGEPDWNVPAVNTIPVQQYPSDYTFDIYKGTSRRTYEQTSKHEAYQVKELNERITVTPSSKEVIESAVSRMVEMFGGKINLPITTITTDKLRKMRETGSGPVTFIDDFDFDSTITASAFIHNGVIYVNTDFKFVDSPLHEVLHVICAAMKLNPKYKDKYYEWMNKLRQENPEMIKSFEARYPNKKGSDLKEEVFIAMIGESFRNRFTDLWGPSKEQMRSEIKEAVTDVFNQIFLTEINPKDTDGVSLGSTNLGYMLKIANTKLFNPENAHITRTCVPTTQLMATLKNKLIIEYGDEC